MKKDKGFVINRTVYPWDIYIYYGDNKKAIDFMVEHTDENYRPAITRQLNNDYSAHAIHFDNGNMGIHFKELTPALMAHEALHLTEYMFQNIGSKHSKKTSEPFAYLMHWIIDEINKGLK